MRILICLVLVSGLGFLGRAQAPATTIDLLDGYAAGHFEAVVARLAETTNFRHLWKDLKADGHAWIDAGGTADRDRRALAAATFALEAARADEWKEWKWLQRQTTIGGPGEAGHSLSPVPVLYWMPPPLLIEWGCQLLREDETPRPIERIWQLAAMAVAQRSEDSQFLVGFTQVISDDPAPPSEPAASAPPRLPSIPGLPGLMLRPPRPIDEVVNQQKQVGHLNHVVERFPREKRFMLGEGLARERSSMPDAIKVYNALLSDPQVGGEAAVRLGAVHLRQNRESNALDLFARAERLTRDRDVLYLAYFYRGQAQLRSRHESDAMAAFRAALRVRPGSQSASVALATLLTKVDQRAEAQRIMKAVVDAGPQHGDPHLEYVHGDDRFWPQLIARLRKEIAR